MLKLLKRIWYAFQPVTLEIPDYDGNYLEGMTIDKLEELYRQVFNTRVGKIILADLEAKYGRSSLQPGPDGTLDPLDLAAREGSRKVLLRLKHMSKED